MDFGSLEASFALSVSRSIISPCAYAYLKGGKIMVPLSKRTLRPLRLRVMTASSWNHSTTGAGSPPAEHSSLRPVLFEKRAEVGGCEIQNGGRRGSGVVARLSSVTKTCVKLVYSLRLGIRGVDLTYKTFSHFARGK